jgi:hypothetical protein
MHLAKQYHVFYQPEQGELNETGYWLMQLLW